MTNLDEFVRDRAQTWTELEALVERGGNAPSKLGPVAGRGDEAFELVPALGSLAHELV